ncbi:type I 3-dehydroquinate dehydratase [Desulfosarcina sp. OttesenSCG-928-G10]|nr:type I 3-dehydroquinate dehydratase [Desulfosarcina sp. OttesenSCG-928-G10]MDL2320897.1 type I 3-dehydroquinate dehydratase [Desulfosarcina sp. OttesenSCG-928-B08]
MRVESDLPVRVRNTVIGGTMPLICIPLIAADTASLLEQAEEMVVLKPDLMEWRIDGYHGLDDERACRNALSALRSCMGSLPLILTCRMPDEGGMQSLSRETRLSVLRALIQTGEVDLTDIEMANDEAFIGEIKAVSALHGVRLIYSAHDFSRTPDAAAIVRLLEKAQALGADIAKVAVAPTCFADSLTLMQATLSARTGPLKIPMITMAMGQMGRVTRIAGGLFGSDITFAAGQIPSAPGQIPITELRQAMAILYP